LKSGEEYGILFGREAGGKAAAAEALKAFKIGITKDRVGALKKLFIEVGEKAGIEAGQTRYEMPDRCYEFFPKLEKRCLPKNIFPKAFSTQKIGGGKLG